MIGSDGPLVVLSGWRKTGPVGAGFGRQSGWTRGLGPRRRVARGLRLALVTTVGLGQDGHLVRSTQILGRFGVEPVETRRGAPDHDRLGRPIGCTERLAQDAAVGAGFGRESGWTRASSVGASVDQPTGNLRAVAGL